ncbi:MAG: hypothetical protein LBP59_09540 [Planctomycetaceae bacterium]|jgi:hypothetical protein|nr:hypothetical protein [Planctomycetaceae bacterium]
MKNVQFIFVYTIIVSIVAIALLVVVIMNYQTAKKVAAELSSAKSAAKEADEKSRAAAEDVTTLKLLIDASYGNVTVATIKDEHKKDMWKYTPGENESQTYRFSLANLYDELDATKKELEQKNNTFTQLTADYNNLQTLYGTVVKKHDEERDKASKDLVTERTNFKNTLATISEQLINLENQKNAIQTKADQDLKTANDTVNKERSRADNAESRSSELGSKLQQLLRPIFDRPDGVVEVVDLNTRAVIVDVGYADGVETRMTFSVYDPKVSGISYDTNLYGENPVLCESCKRNVSLHASKASIEITRILGPHRSEARIIIDQLVNPILTGDVIHSPIWDRGQNLRIALGAGMFLPDVGNPASDPSLGSLTDVKNMIIECGGKIDCYISDGRTDENVKRGEIIGLENITADTTFVVIGTVKEGTQEPEIMEAQDKIRKKAKSLAIKEISLKELMLKIGWRNPTPLRNYGKEADTYDQKIKPEGGRSPSTGTVAPIYNKPNYSAGVSLHDRGKPVSTGKVADIYSNKSSKTTSTGNVSNLFRTRKPNTNLNQNNQ